MGIRTPALLAALTCATFSGPVEAQAIANEFVPGRLVLTFEEAAVPSEEFISDLGQVAPGDTLFQSALATHGASSMHAVFRSAGTPPSDPDLYTAIGLHRHFVVELDPSADLTLALADFEASPAISVASLDGVLRTSQDPNDPNYGNQWNHEQSNDADMDTNLAWDVTTGSVSTVASVLDTGVDLDHPDLDSKIVAGFDFVNNDSNANDDHGHGTAVAGIIGAETNNNTCVAGIDWNCRIQPVKVLNSGGSGSGTDVAAGIRWAADNGSHVINMSLSCGPPCFLQIIEDAMAYATGLDVLILSSTGNSNASSIGYPADSALSMAIGASSPCDERKSPSSCDGQGWGSNYGTGLDVNAPGVGIPTTSNGGGCTNGFGGTSAACPNTAGVAALLRGIDPSMGQAEVAAIIRSSSEDEVGPPADDGPGWDPQYGFGRVNAFRAVLAMSSARTFCSADGTAAAPPCGNDGGNDVGAENSTGVGAHLVAAGGASVAADSLELTVLNMDSNKLGLLLMGDGLINGTDGVTFFDGLLCVGSGQANIRRLQPMVSDGSGSFTQSDIVDFACNNLPPNSCIMPGQTWYYQGWYRDLQGPCGTGANTTNALQVDWQP